MQIALTPINNHLRRCMLVEILANCAQQFNLAPHEINAVIRTAITVFDHGGSASTASMLGYKIIRTISNQNKVSL